MKNYSMFIIVLVITMLPGGTFSQSSLDGVVGKGVSWSPAQALAASWGSPRRGSLVVRGDTVHMLAERGNDTLGYFRSVDGGLSFEQQRILYPFGGWSAKIFKTGSEVHILFSALIPGISNSSESNTFLIDSRDGGATWSAPHRVPDIDGAVTPVSVNGGTIAFVSFIGHALYVTISTDGGEHWSTKSPPSNVVFTGSAFFDIAVGGGAIHLIAREHDLPADGFVRSEYYRSTDGGNVWSLPTVLPGSRAGIARVVADDRGGAEGSRIFIVKEGEGISLLISRDNGVSFGPEIQLDDRPWGTYSCLSVSGDTLACGWLDMDNTVPSPDQSPRREVISFSTDRGETWTSPFPVALSWESGIVALEGNVVHTVFSVDLSDAVLMYRRGELTPTQRTTHNVLNYGWNLVSLPLKVENPLMAVQFPFSTSGAYTFDGVGTVRTDTLQIGKGYWVKCDRYTRKMSFSGEPVDPETIDVRPGWNMVGCAAGTVVPTGSFESIPSGILTSPLFIYDQGYHVVEELQPGFGCWVRASAEGKIIISSGTKKHIVQPNLSSTRELSKLQITDANGFSQVLYFGSSLTPVTEELRFQMPPSGPSGTFDCRFANGSMAALVKDAAQVRFIPISLTAVTFPLQVQWKEYPHTPSATLVAGNQQAKLIDEGSILLSDQQDELLLKLGGTENTTPALFRISQNYPNPFNPLTMINFDLPSASFVVAKVYDVFGREISTLLNKTMESGQHSVEWNAIGQASGVYFIELKRTTQSGETQLLTSKVLLAK